MAQGCEKCSGLACPVCDYVAPTIRELLSLRERIAELEAKNKKLREKVIEVCGMDVCLNLGDCGGCPIFPFVPIPEG